MAAPNSKLKDEKATKAVIVIYVCHECKSTTKKLWREHSKCVDVTSLLCLDCVFKRSPKEQWIGYDTMDTVDAKTMRQQIIDGRGDQLGWFLPAVPQNYGDAGQPIYAFFAYSSVPDSAVKWWKDLPF